MAPSRPPLPPNPYRLFHLSARLRLRDRPSTSPSQATPPNDDYYALLLSTPLPTPAKKTINPVRAPKSTQPSSSNLPPPSTTSSIETSDKGPDNKVSFGRVLSGPSARMRGLMRAEKGLGRPQEPDNCCMSGCVNCVWDSYREEVEEWAAARRSGANALSESGRARGTEGEEEVGAVGDLDEGYRGVDLCEEDLFEGVPVGIREFMNTEKRLRERRGMERETA